MRIKLATLTLAAVLPFAALQATAAENAKPNPQAMPIRDSLELTAEQREKMQQLRIEHRKQMREILTPEQQEKFDAMQQQREKRRQEFSGQNKQGKQYKQHKQHKQHKQYKQHRHEHGGKYYKQHQPRMQGNKNQQRQDRPRMQRQQ